MDFKNLQKIWLAAALFVSACIIIRQHYLLAATSLRALSFPPPLVVNIAPMVRTEAKWQGSESSKLFTPLRWVVMDAVVAGCHDVTAYEKQNDWGVIIVTSVPQDIAGCRTPKCVQLTRDSVRTDLHQFETPHLLGHPDLLSGYLWAITRGATSILRVGCPGLPLTDISRTLGLADDRPVGLWVNSTTVFDPSRHWGQPVTVDEIEQKVFAGDVVGHQSKYSTSDMFYLGDLEDVTIRHTVCVSNTEWMSDPDKDTPVRMSPVAIGPDVVTPLPAGPTLFLNNSFYYMFKPIGVEITKLTLFETLWIHELRRLRLVNEAFYPSISPRLDKSHLCSHNYGNNTRGHVKLRNMFGCVHAKTRDHTSDTKDCVAHVAETIFSCLNFNPGSIARNVDLLKAWLTDLSSLGFSAIRPQNVSLKNAFKIKYRQGAILSRHDAQLGKMCTRISQSMAEVCSNHFKPRLSFLDATSHPVMDDVLLIIVVNYESLFRNVPYTEFMHRPYFKYILYCGPSAARFASFAADIGLAYLSYVEGLTNGWHLMYECVTHGMKLGLPVKGYLQIGEDVLLNTWNLAGLPRGRIWMPAGFTTRRLYSKKRVLNWFHWNTPMGQRAVIKVFSELKLAAGDLSSPSNRARLSQDFAKRFLANYEHNIGSDSIIHRAMDIFYIPEMLRDDFVMASELFQRHGSMIEIALPVIHLGLARKEEVVYISGSSLWGEDRTRPWTYYDDVRKVFIHPFKLLLLTSQLDGKRFFCEVFLPRHELGLTDSRQLNTS